MNQEEDFDFHSEARRARAIQRSSSGSWLSFFDFRFRRYLTPYIIRLYWILILIGATLKVGQLAVATISSSFSNESTVSREIENDFPLFRQPRQARSQFAEQADAVVNFVIYVIALVMAVLAVRVVCEAFIVMFNIANTLTEIRDRIDRG